MTAAKGAIGARTALTTTALNSLASSNYVSAGVITFATGGKTPLTDKIEVVVTPGTVSGNKQLVVFAQQSLDGINFETGPSTGSNAADEANLTYIGAVPCNTNTAQQARIFDLAAAFGGNLPFAARIIIKNETGATLAGSGHGVYYAEITGDLT